MRTLRNQHRLGSVVHAVSFSSSSTILNPQFNIMCYTPRGEIDAESPKRFADFSSTHSDLVHKINSAQPSFKPISSVSITDIAHFPANNLEAFRWLVGGDIMKPSSKVISPSMIMPHFSGISRSKEEADQKIELFRDSGVEHIFVVRGNLAVLGKDPSYYHPQGYRDVASLIYRIKELAPDIKIMVAAYPEKHPYAQSLDADFEELRKKIDCGADGMITQHFFDPKAFEEFCERCQKHSINLPIIPSIMPIGSPKYTKIFSDSAGVKLPAEVLKIYEAGGVQETDGSIKDPKTEELAVEYSAKLIQEVMRLNPPQVNTYVANLPNFLEKVFQELGLVSQKSVDSSRGGRG